MERKINKVRLLMAAILGATTISFSAGYSSEAESKVADVTLMTDNTVVIDEEINEESVSKAIRQIIEVNDEEVNIFINSPGGSVFAGMRLVDFLATATSKTTNCIVQFAASMAFVITQACDNRYVVGSGVLMQHQASYGLRSAPRRNQQSFISLLDSVLDDMTALQTRRLGITTSQFENMIAHDKWFTAKQAAAANAVDKVVSATCSRQLLDKEIPIELPIFNLTVVFSGCPLITAPIRVDNHDNVAEEVIKTIVTDLTPDYTKLESESIKRINRGE